MIIPPNIDRLSLCAEQFSRDLGFIVSHFLGDLGKTSRQVLILSLLSQGLRPIQREIEVTPAVVDFTHLTGRRLVALQELGIGLVERVGQNFCRLVVRHFGEML